MTGWELDPGGGEEAGGEKSGRKAPGGRRRGGGDRLIPFKHLYHHLSSLQKKPLHHAPFKTCCTSGSPDQGQPRSRSQDVMLGWLP